MKIKLKSNYDFLRFKSLPFDLRVLPVEPESSPELSALGGMGNSGAAGSWSTIDGIDSTGAGGGMTEPPTSALSSVLTALLGDSTSIQVDAIPGDSGSSATSLATVVVRFSSDGDTIAARSLALSKVVCTLSGICLALLVFIGDVLLPPKPYTPLSLILTTSGFRSSATLFIAFRRFFQASSSSSWLSSPLSASSSACTVMRPRTPFG
eukprot:GSChrysophyteH1.ASY1.ANO1.2028.1 assembled CDS